MFKPNVHDAETRAMLERQVEALLEPPSITFLGNVATAPSGIGQAVALPRSGERRAENRARQLCCRFPRRLEWSCHPAGTGETLVGRHLGDPPRPSRPLAAGRRFTVFADRAGSTDRRSATAWPLPRRPERASLSRSREASGVAREWRVIFGVRAAGRTLPRRSTRRQRSGRFEFEDEDDWRLAHASSVSYMRKRPSGEMS